MKTLFKPFPFVIPGEKPEFLITWITNSLTAFFIHTFIGFACTQPDSHLKTLWPYFCRDFQRLESKRDIFTGNTNGALHNFSINVSARVTVSILPESPLKQQLQFKTSGAAVVQTRLEMKTWAGERKCSQRNYPIMLCCDIAKTSVLRR